MTTGVKFSLMSAAVFFAFVSAVGAGAGTAGPRILPVENARRNIERHEWAREVLERARRFPDRHYMDHDREFYNELIPDLTPDTISFTTCPVCFEKDPDLMGKGFWRLDTSSYDKIICRRCDTRYPNEEYPETGVLECPRMGQTFTYYERPGERKAETDEERINNAFRWDALRPGTERATSFSGLLRRSRVDYARGRMLAFARLYALTEEIRYAERASWILLRLAEVFPNYLYHDGQGAYADCPPEEAAVFIGDLGNRFPPDVVRHPYGERRHLTDGFWHSGRMVAGGSCSDAPALWQIIQAYYLVKDAVYPDGTPLLREEERETIINDLIVAGCKDIEKWTSLNNKSIATRRVIAGTGILLNDHERVRRAVNDFETFIESGFFHFDGISRESPSYTNHAFGNTLPLPMMLKGYSDPPGYIPPEGGRIEDFNPFREGALSLALRSYYRQLAPGYLLPPISNSSQIDYLQGTLPRMSISLNQLLAYYIDSSYGNLLDDLLDEAPVHGVNAANEFALWYRPADIDETAEAKKLPPLRSEWFPGWHVGVLRGGRPDKTALYFLGAEDWWTMPTPHRQADLLSLCYFEFGRQVASDPGWGQWTHFNYSTIVHNTVVVDGESQGRGGYFGTIKGTHLELAGMEPGVEIIQARGYGCYEQCDRYMRTSALIKKPGGDSTYVADFFRVRGGEKHQYSFHGVGDLVNINPPDKPVPIEGTISGGRYITDPRAVLHNLRELRGATPYTFTWMEEDIYLDLMLLNEDMIRIVIADNPRIPLGRVINPPHIERILAEKRAPEGSNDLETNYAAVIVPHKGSSPVLSARLIANGSDAGALAMEVRFADRTDYIISTLDQQLRQYGPVSAAGRFAYVSVDSEGNAVQGYLLAGTQLSCGELDITLEAPEKTLKVKKVSDRTIYLAEPLPEGWGRPGTYLLSSGPPPRHLEHETPQTGFRIESATADTITVEDYPVQPTEEVILLNSKKVQIEK